MDNEHVKVTTGSGYNAMFNKVTGFHARWGESEEDNPEMAPCPEILDIEIATACDGIEGAPCHFCYKTNKRAGEQMSIETFKVLFDKLPKTVTQIAFGIGNLYGHDGMWEIFEYTRANGVVPNVTINGWQLTDRIADRLANVMGAVAVSRYEPKDTCYSAVLKLTSRGMKQVNIHQLVSEQTYSGCMDLLHDMQVDSRLVDLNAAVFLMLKPKGRGKVLGQLKDRVRYKALVEFALERNLRIGFDSCSVPSFLSVTEGHPNYAMLKQSTDRCESGLFSLYIDVKGRAWPCSFGQDRSDLEPINVLEVESFERDVWLGPELTRWRKRLTGNCRSCPLFDIDIPKKK